jgi:hypothetical protein
MFKRSFLDILAKEMAVLDKQNVLERLVNIFDEIRRGGPKTDIN